MAQHPTTPPHRHHHAHGDADGATRPYDRDMYHADWTVVWERQADRAPLWAAWLDRHGPSYVPDNTASTSLRGHRIDDQIVSLLSPPTTPRDMLDVTDFYSYDSLAVG